MFITQMATDTADYERMEQVTSRMRQLIMGFRTTQLLHVAAKLNIADKLDAGPRTAQELAEQVNVLPAALYRLLRALTSLDVLTETAEGAFALTSTGKLLRSNLPGSMRNVALLYGEDWLWRAYGNLQYSVETGRPAFPETHGVRFYDFLSRNPEAAAVFHAAMTDFSGHEARAIVDAYDFAGVDSIVDVGAGQGALLAAILRAYRHVSGLAFDLPAAEPEFHRMLGGSDLPGRARFVAGDFFDVLPHGADVYLLKSVLHNWDNAAVLRILQVCRRAIAPAGRLLVIERLVTSESVSSEAKLFDINMLVTVGGQERTEREYAELLEQAEFRLVRTVPTLSPLTILEAVPVT